VYEFPCIAHGANVSLIFYYFVLSAFEYNVFICYFFLSPAIELIKELMEYEVSDSLLKGLVSLLRPAKEDLIRKPEILDGKKTYKCILINHNQSILLNFVIIHIRLKVLHFVFFYDKAN